jgi:hypothetical protein
VTAPADIYTAASGMTIYGGRTAPSSGGGGGAGTDVSWVPPVGYFADVPMTNTVQSQTPSIYSSGDTNAPFTYWTGSAVLADYSALGAQVYYGAGHETAGGQPNIQMSIVLDFSTLTWAIRNVPAAVNNLNAFSPGDGTGYAPDHTPYAGHTYMGLQEFPHAWGGAVNGSLVSFFIAGSDWPNRANVLDVSQATHGYSQLVTTQAQNAQPTKISFSANGGAAGGTYPTTAIDRVRQGWWLNAMGGTIDYLLFCAKNGTITQYPALNGNMQDGAMVLCDSLDLLVAIDGGYDSGPNAGSSYRTLCIRNLTTGTYTTASATGPVPATTYGYESPPPSAPNYHRPVILGLQWVPSLGCMVGLDDTVSPPNVVKLTPPSSNPATAPWTWSVATVAHWSAGDPSGNTVLRGTTNGALGKFRYVPTLGAFVYCVSNSTKPQVIKLG